MRIPRSVVAVALAAAVAVPMSAGASEHEVIPVPPTCTQNFGGGSRGTLVVTAGQVVCVNGTTINGSIVVNPGGALVMTGGLVRGNVVTVGAEFLKLCGVTVRGSVTAQSSPGFVQLGEAGNGHLPCAGNTITNSVSVLSGMGGYIVSSNTVGGNVTVNDNVGVVEDPNPYEIAGNTVGGSLTCLRNDPPPEDHGYPNVVTGTLNCELQGEQR